MLAYEVCPHVFLASYGGAREAASAPDADYFVVNCTRDLPMVAAAAAAHVRVAVDDNGTPTSMEALLGALPSVVDAMHGQASRGRDVLVHCLAGQQRSPAVVAAYLVRHHGHTLDSAVRHVRACKPDAFLGGINFWRSLERFAGQ